MFAHLESPFISGHTGAASLGPGRTPEPSGSEPAVPRAAINAVLAGRHSACIRGGAASNDTLEPLNKIRRLVYTVVNASYLTRENYGY